MPQTVSEWLGVAGFVLSLVRIGWDVWVWSRKDTREAEAAEKAQLHRLEEEFRNRGKASVETNRLTQEAVSYFKKGIPSKRLRELLEEVLLPYYSGDSGRVEQRVVAVMREVWAVEEGKK